MLSERERHELRAIERDLAADPGFAATMRGVRPPRTQRRPPIWIVPLFVVALVATIFCAVLGSAVGVVVCAVTSVAVLGLSGVVAARGRAARVRA